MGIAMIRLGANPGQETLGPFLTWIFLIVVVTGAGSYLGVVAWSLAGLRSGQRLAIFGLVVVLFAIIYGLLP